MKRKEPRREIGRIPRLVWLSAAFVFLFCAGYNVLVFDRVPHIHDEIAYLFQARIFLTGHFSAPLPCATEAFDFPHIINIDRWYSIYPPGFPLLLSLGLLLGIPWLVNPALGAAAIILVFFLGAEIYDRRTGVLAAILGALSIWLLLMSATMMSHTASMFFNALGLLFILRSWRSPTIRNGLIAGLSFGAAFLIRPYSMFVFALPFLLFFVIRLLRDFRARWKNAVTLALAAGAFLGAFLFYNARTTGHPLTPGYIARYGTAYSVIFGRPATLDYSYTPLVASHQLWKNLEAINAYLFGWPLSSFWFLTFIVLGAIASPSSKKRELFLLSTFLSMLAGYYFFWGSFIAIGARMFFDFVPIALLLSARGLSQAQDFMAARFRMIAPRSWNTIIAGVLAVFSLYGFFVTFPRWVSPPAHRWYYERYDGSMCGSTAGIHKAIVPLGLRHAVVVMRFFYVPMAGFPTGWWGSGFLYNTPGLEGNIIFANDRGPDVTRQLFRCFPGRSFYYYLGTLEKGILVPLQLDGDRLLLGEPLVPKIRPWHASQLVASPQEIFTLYSAEFETFVTQTFQQERWMDMDVNLLAALSRTYTEAREYGKAIYALEAALQVENTPRIRAGLLEPLARLYRMTGKAAEARRVQGALANSYDQALYNLIPEKGF